QNNCQFRAKLSDFPVLLDFLTKCDDSKTACRASSPKRRLWRIKQGEDGAAVKIHRRSKP
ncbi:MAG: hypothetical protein IJN38_07980, partial [Clostridia bacterium]|nr:hypothetical protein [Clostridia bacterium]